MGDGVLLNGADGQAARRVHMRELTMARQAAEQRLNYPLFGGEDTTSTNSWLNGWPRCARNCRASMPRMRPGCGIRLRNPGCRQP